MPAQAAQAFQVNLFGYLYVSASAEAFAVPDFAEGSPASAV